MSVVAGAKAGFGSLKAHWLFFTILILVLIMLAIGYDKKNGTFSAWRAKAAGWPIVGTIFTALALTLGGALRLHGVV